MARKSGTTGNLERGFDSIKTEHAPAPAARTSPSPAAPPIKLLWREGASLAYIKLTASLAKAVPLGVDGNGQKVLVLPGFMASDRSTARLRQCLSASGFDVHGWGMGLNRGLNKDIIAQLRAVIEPIAADGPVTLVGWSLGGLLAREYAKHHREHAAKVITLGSPFSGCPRANNVWRLYEFVAGYKVDRPPIAVALHEKPPVPTIAFWSPRDGVIGQDAARGMPGESDQRIELDCGHMEFVADENVFRHIAAAILG